MIRVVSFDLDDTLYDFVGSSRRALDFVARHVREAVGEMAASLDADRVILDLLAAADSMKQAYAHLDELRRRAFTRTLARYRVDDPELVQGLCETYVKRRFENLSLYEGALEVLNALKATYKLCVVSNGEQDLGMLGLDGVFEFVVLASDVGCQKPEPRIFQVAIGRAGCSPREFVHVGDSLLSDVVGASAVGARTIWYNVRGEILPIDVVPDREILSLSELPAAVRELDSEAPG